MLRQNEFKEALNKVLAVKDRFKGLRTKYYVLKAFASTAEVCSHGLGRHCAAHFGVHLQPSLPLHTKGILFSKRHLSARPGFQVILSLLEDSQREAKPDKALQQPLRSRSKSLLDLILRRSIHSSGSRGQIFMGDSIKADDLLDKPDLLRCKKSLARVRLSVLKE